MGFEAMTYLCDSGAVLYQLSYQANWELITLYDLSYIHRYSSPSAGNITNPQCNELPVGFIAQLVEHCTGVAEVMGSNPVQA